MYGHRDPYFRLSDLAAHLLSQNGHIQSWGLEAFLCLPFPLPIRSPRKNKYTSTPSQGTGPAKYWFHEGWVPKWVSFFAPRQISKSTQRGYFICSQYLRVPAHGVHHAQTALRKKDASAVSMLRCVLWLYCLTMWPNSTYIVFTLHYVLSGIWRWFNIHRRVCIRYRSIWYPLI